MSSSKISLRRIVSGIAAVVTTAASLALSPLAANAAVATVSVNPSALTAVIGQPMTPTTVTTTGTTPVNRVADLLNVRTIAGPTGANVTPQTVTTTELAGIQGVAQLSTGDFVAIRRSMTHVATVADSLVRVSRSTGAVTALTGSFGATITNSNLFVDSSDNLYVAQGNDVVQIALSGNTFAETGAKVSAVGVRGFQVTPAGRVYIAATSGALVTATMPLTATTNAAVAYPSSNPVTLPALNHGSNVYAIWVDEAVAGDPANSRVFVNTDNMGAVYMATVSANSGSSVVGISTNYLLGNYQAQPVMVMDAGKNLYFVSQNCVRRLDTNGLTQASSARDSVYQAGDCTVSPGSGATLSQVYQRTAAASGYVDGPYGTSRLYIGSPIVPASNPATIDGIAYRSMGALALDLKGSNPTGELIIADTGNAALRAMNRVGWSVSPALHAGLTLSATGAISGTPTGTVGLSPANNVKTYTIRYYNEDGSSVSGSVAITFEIAPTSFAYSYAGTFFGNPYWVPIDTQSAPWGTAGSAGQFAINQPVELACPMTVGANLANPPLTTCGVSALVSNANLGLPTATTFAISPALPAGFTFNTTNGAIAGTPTAYAATQNYTVTATNSHGSTTYVIPLGVPQPKTITFDANGGTGTMAAQQGFSFASISSNTFTAPANKVFTGWNTAANASGFAYTAWDQYSFAADVTLYAQWATQYTIDRDANGGLYTATSTSNNSAWIAGQPATFAQQGPFAGGLRANGVILDDPSEAFAEAVEKPGATQWAGWSTNASGVGADIYMPGDSWVVTGNMTLYSLWVAAGTTWTASYDLQGGTNSAGPLTPITGLTSGTRPLVDSGANLTKAGFVFTGWNSKPDGSGADRAYGYKIYADTMAYAQWAPVPVATAFTPSQLPLAGGLITITGTGLNSSNVSSITVGGQSLNWGSWLINPAGTQMQIFAPALSAGAQSVVVTYNNSSVLTGSVTYSANPSSSSSSNSSSNSSSSSSNNSNSTGGSGTYTGTAPHVTASTGGRVAPNVSGQLTLSGYNLNTITRVTVGGVVANVTSSTAGSITIALPALAVGNYAVTLTGSNGSFTLTNAVQVSSLPISTGSTGPAGAVEVSKVFAGFAGDSAVISAAQKRAITAFVKANKSAGIATCVGSTSNTKVTAKDVRLARARAVAVCALVKKLIPGVVVEIKVTPSSGLGSPARRVTLGLWK